MRRAGFAGGLGLLVAATALWTGRAAAQAQSAAAPVTYSKHVAPILQRACQQCHRPNSIAPMSLLTYQDVRPWARAIRQRVVAREMPPWSIEKTIGIQQFKDDPSLTDEEVANKGGATLRLDLVKNDKPPVVTITAPASVPFPSPITLTATVTDDGLPPPPRGTPQQVTRDVFIEDARPTLPPGLTVRWAQYRGPGHLTFDKPGPTRIANGPTSVVARASARGTYVVRVTASDGLMETHQNISVVFQ